jgi:lysophospholipase L1-like esterase
MKARRWLPNLLLALGSLLFFGGVAEFVARAIDLRPAHGSALANPAWLGDRMMLRADYRDEMAKAGVLSRYYELYEWDRYLFYRLRPDVDVELIDVFAPPQAREKSRWRARTNSRGFRAPEFAATPAKDTVRIAVLGDSSTFGWGVDDADTYPALLGPALAKRLGVDPSRVEILNLGVPGYSSFQGRVLLERSALGYEPDAVVWSYLSNDGAVTGVSDEASYAQRLGASGALLAVLHRSRAFETLEAWIAVLRAHWQPPVAPDPTDSGQRNVPNYRVAGANVAGAVELANDAGIPIVLLGQCTRKLPAEVMAAVARDTGAPYLDATGLLDASVPGLQSDVRFADWRAQQSERYGSSDLAAHPRWLAFLPDACHPNAMGHRLVADALAEMLANTLAAAKP